MRKLDISISMSYARRIVNARNKLTHGYDEIETVQIWSIIVKDISVLKKEINSLLAD